MFVSSKKLDDPQISKRSIAEPPCGSKRAPFAQILYRGPRRTFTVGSSGFVRVPSFRGLRQLTDVPCVTRLSEDKWTLSLPREMKVLALSQHLAEVTGGPRGREQERGDERVTTRPVMNGRVTGLLVVTLRGRGQTAQHR